MTDPTTTDRAALVELLRDVLEMMSDLNQDECRSVLYERVAQAATALAAVRAETVAEAVRVVEGTIARIASTKADKECKGREGVWEMIEGEERARLMPILDALRALGGQP